MNAITKLPREEIALAKICVEEAERILTISPRIAAREAYLAMFHGAQARIAATGKAVPNSHKGVSMIVGDIYRGTDFPAQMQLSEVENWKSAADYGRGAFASATQAAAAVATARTFLARMIVDIPSQLLEPVPISSDIVDKLRALDQEG